MAPHPDHSWRWPLRLFLVTIPLAWACSTAAAWDWSSAWETYSSNPTVFAPLLAFAGSLLTILVAGTAALVALGQLRTARLRHEAQTEADRQRRITDSFLKAVEQLGSDKMPVRVGGIYSLERIAKESQSDYWTVMETLTAFVRQQARWKGGDPAPSDTGGPPTDITAVVDYWTVMGTLKAFVRKKERAPFDPWGGPPTDITAVIAVIKRRSAENREREKVEGWHLDLELTDLSKADLRYAHLERADLRYAHLEEANLQDAHLEGVLLWGAHLEGAYLVGAHLKGADLLDAHLERADLVEAHLERADLVGAHLERAHLVGAHLEEANLRDAYLEEANLRDAHLEGADLVEAHLERADLVGAHLEGADLMDVHLEGADLQGATGLTQEKLDEAFGDANTNPPEGLTCTRRWS